MAGALILFGVPPAVAAEGEKPKSDILEVYSQGYSSYTIQDGDVVALFTGGVDFSYQGYRMKAEELHFDQADGSAEVNGAVEVTLEDGSTLNCGKIIVKGAEGTGSIPGKVYGNFVDPKMTMSAGSAAFSFPPGKHIKSARELTFILQDGVNLTSADGYTVSTATAQYDGATGGITVSGQVALTGTIVMKNDSGEPKEQWITLTGASLSGQLAQETGSSWIEMNSVNVQFADGWLSTGQIRIEPKELVDSPDTPAWHVELQNGPVSGVLRQKAGDLTISAEAIAGDFDRKGPRQMELTGSASVQRDGVQLESSKITVTRGDEAYDFSAPGLMEARLNFAQLSGSEPIDISTIEGWLD